MRRSMPSGWVHARAPATIANVGPGFDVFCLAVRGLSDEVAIRPAAADSLRVEGLGVDFIPADFAKNTAGIVIDALRDATGISQPLEVRVRKGIPAARGLGSSAASCAAAALAFLKAFPASKSLGAEGFIRAAVEGEAAVAGRHYDNVTGALLGGFVTIASTEPLVVAREPVSPRIALAIAVPELVLRTSEMRRVLPDVVPLRDAVANVGRAATLAFALSRGDIALAGRCLEDRLAEPARSPFLRGFPEARAAAIAAGGSGCAISGSGSTVFALAAQPRIAERVSHAMCNAFQHHDIRATPIVTSVDNRVPLGEVFPHSGPRFSIPA
ncbi:MAG: homoserine kinase [Methanobacteriota archaeon]|nr:MAG: homoserine kinase [Euryarchaeota archaeon]